jgi:hypothetical protein
MVNTEEEFEEMDENLDHELVYEDPAAELYKSVVARREKLLSISRFLWHTTFTASFLACMWLTLITRDFWWLAGATVFFALSALNVQVLNYRGILTQAKKAIGQE